MRFRATMVKRNVIPRCSNNEPIMRRLRNYSIELILVLLLAIAVTYFGYLGYGLLYATNNFDGDLALTKVEQQLKFGARVTGTKSNTLMGDWLVSELNRRGWKMYIQPYTLANAIEARNIIAVYKNERPNAPVAMLATHYDSRQFADADENAANHTLPTPGANSNASGVAILMELARVIDVQASGHTICIVFWDADANANLEGWEPAAGSSYFVQSVEKRIPECSKPRVALVIDTVGFAEQPLFIMTNDQPGLNSAIQKTAEELAFANRFSPTPPQLIGPLQTPLLQLNIPIALITDFAYPYRAKMQDTVDKISSDALFALGRTLEAWLENGAIF